ncbi:MAG: VanZ family protein [Chloroflexota bacterium]|nr:VanZ family protein [Chloroflexota bacterium]
MRTLIWRWLPALAWMGLIFFVSAQPSLPSAPAWWDVILKKTMHAVAYAILTWLYLGALRGTWEDDRIIRVASVILAVAYAISDEVHQTFVPGRNGTLVDVLLDGVGILSVMLLDSRHANRGCSRGPEVSE